MKNTYVCWGQVPLANHVRPVLTPSLAYGAACLPTECSKDDSVKFENYCWSHVMMERTRGSIASDMGGGLISPLSSATETL